MIEANLTDVKQKINEACSRSGRDAKDITLIAVSKTKPVEMLLEAYKAGARDFGENKVQEITEKYPLLPDDIRWHMIGHLQRNKIKYIIDKVVMIHSVDSMRLAQAISDEAVKHNLVMDILVEVNIADEESKYGVKPDMTEEFVKEIAVLPGIHVRGLMTVAPFTEKPDSNSKFFCDLHKIAVDIKSKNIDNVSMDVLSMGMTNDYECAIENGSTMVRVGTGIFGARNYSL